MGDGVQAVLTVLGDSRAAIVSAIVGGLITVALTNPVHNWWTRRKVAKAEADIRALVAPATGIHILEYGPDITVDHASIRSVDERFTLAIPLDAARVLDLDPTFEGEMYAGTDVFGAPDLARLGDILKIADVETLVEPHIAEVARQFVEREHGISFNSKLIGVRAFRRTRIGHDERPYLSLDCYETDYFTFKVMDRLHRQIKRERPEGSLLSLVSDRDIKDRLYPFLASVGLNFIVIGSDDKIVLSRRSRNLDRFGLRGSPIYPSFNEALSWADRPTRQAGFGQVPSIPRCVLRGLHEELGVQEREVDRTSFRLIGMGDVGIGFGVYGFVHLKLTSAEVLNRFAGPDRAFEAERFFSVPVERASLNSILKSAETSAQVAVLINALKADNAL